MKTVWKLHRISVDFIARPLAFSGAFRASHLFLYYSRITIYLHVHINIGSNLMVHRHTVCNEILFAPWTNARHRLYITQRPCLPLTSRHYLWTRLSICQDAGAPLTSGVMPLWHLPLQLHTDPLGYVVCRRHFPCGKYVIHAYIRTSDYYIEYELYVRTSCNKIDHNRFISISLMW